MITNTHSVGTVRDAFIKWQVARTRKIGTGVDDWSLPIVAETWDGYLNDINGFHVTDTDTVAALDSAKSGPVQKEMWAAGRAWFVTDLKGEQALRHANMDLIQ